MVGDGVDRTERAAIARRKIDEIVEFATSPETDVELWVLCFTLAEEEPLVALEALAQRTAGRYRRVAVEDRGQLAQRLEALVGEIERTFVVTLVPGRPASKRATAFEIVLRLPDGSVGRATSQAPVLAP